MMGVDIVVVVLGLVLSSRIPMQSLINVVGHTYEMRGVRLLI